MDEAVLCLGCMGLNSSDKTVCPRCGFNEESYLEKLGKKAPFYLNLGTKLGGDRYIIGRVVGQGNFGITYAGLDTNEDRRIMVKEYMPRSLAYRSPHNQQVLPFNESNRVFFAYGLQQFLKEAALLADLRSEKGIVEVCHAFQQNNTGYMVMEYLEGRTLEHHLQLNPDGLNWDEALDIISPLLASLARVHGAGLLHRDISPDNIFICTSGASKLYDFGGARQALIDENKDLSVVLKPGYAPLENYVTRGRRGPWTDIYALAATLFRMVTATRIPEATVRVENDTVPRRLAEAAGIPSAVHPVLLKALAIKPEDRYLEVLQFRDDLAVAGGGRLPVPESSEEFNPMPGGANPEKAGREGYAASSPEAMAQETGNENDVDRSLRAKGANVVVTEARPRGLLAAGILIAAVALAAGGAYLYLYQMDSIMAIIRAWL